MTPRAARCALSPHMRLAPSIRTRQAVFNLIQRPSTRFRPLLTAAVSRSYPPLLTCRCLPEMSRLQLGGCASADTVQPEHHLLARNVAR
eukprot:4712067-Pleurochrysis_carterae.AAC.2